MSYDETKGRKNIRIFSDDDYDYEQFEVVPDSMFDQLLKDANYISGTDADIVINAKENIQYETFIMIHIFPILMIAYGKLIHDEKNDKQSENHAKYMVIILNALSVIDSLRTPGWLEAIRATLGSITGIFDEGSSMRNFINAISNYDENKNKSRAAAYAEMKLLRPDDRLNGQPKCTNAPLDINMIVEQSGPSAITKVNSALNEITYSSSANGLNIEEPPEIITNKIFWEGGPNPNGGKGQYLISEEPYSKNTIIPKGTTTPVATANTPVATANTSVATANPGTDENLSYGGSTHVKSRRIRKKRACKKTKTRRIGLRAQFGCK